MSSGCVGLSLLAVEMLQLPRVLVEESLLLDTNVESLTVLV